MGEEGENKPAAPQNNVGMGVLCYLGILVLIPLLTDAKNDPFVKFHIKQGLVLLIFCILVSVVMGIPVLGWIVGGIGWIVEVVFLIMGIVNVVNGKQEPLPLIGQYADKFNI